MVHDILLNYISKIKDKINEYVYSYIRIYSCSKCICITGILLTIILLLHGYGLLFFLFSIWLTMQSISNLAINL